MAIVDPRTHVFADESLRPTCEKIRALKAEVDAMVTEWNSEISALIPNDPAERLDGSDGNPYRASEGVSILFGDDIHNAMSQVIAFQTQMDQPGVADVISLPCVRTLSVN